MEVRDWTVYHPLYEGRKVVDSVNLHVRRGEVVGISGLMGAGRTELAMSIFGKSYGANISGTLLMDGREVRLHNVQDAIDHKLAYVTEDRKGNGLILSAPIRENTTLAKMDKVSRRRVLDKDLEIQVANEYREKLHTKCADVEQAVGNLSGGNQQKVLLAKWMFADPDVLILDEPTRGIDVGAKYEIYCIINQLVAEGKSVVMISSELPEVLGMCDRIYVMNEGRIVGELSREEASQESIMSCILQSGKGAEVR
ncbi:MAG: ATP-binding cassette domain-containing protein, partial [Anaerotruncus colihominis]